MSAHEIARLCVFPLTTLGRYLPGSALLHVVLVLGMCSSMDSTLNLCLMSRFWSTNDDSKLLAPPSLMGLPEMPCMLLCTTFRDVDEVASISISEFRLGPDTIIGMRLSMFFVLFAEETTLG